MTNIKQGNILNCKEDIIVHQVNVQGVMGGGVARQLANRFKYLEDNYAIYCDEYGNDYTNLRGDVYFYISDKVIANIFSQRVNFDTDYYNMERALYTVKAFAQENNYSIAIPYGIGCGIAKGDWNKVYGIIEEVFNDYDVTLYRLEEQVMFCTENERKTCNVEKMGCEGCYYNSEEEVEEWLEHYEEFRRNKHIFKSIEPDFFFKFVDYLINRNKELEEAVDNFMKGKAYSTKQLENINKKYILKSKVKEKIEELKEEFHKLDKQIDIKKTNKTMQDYYEEKEKITTMQTISWLQGELQELLEE